MKPLNKNLSKNIEKRIVYLLLFLLPTQLAFHFWPSWAFVFGIRVDFLAPAIYLTDILALILIFSNLGIYRKYLKYLLVLLFFAAVNTFYSTSPPESLYKWLKIFEIVGVGIYFVKSKIKTEKIFRALFYSAVLFSFIGIAQFVKGGTTGLFYVLGERSFSMMTPGIALIKISGQNFLRAYSTFSHPNSLAAYLAVIIILFLDFKKKTSFDYFCFLIISTCFILAFSGTAFIGILLSLCFKFVFNNKKTFRILAYSILCSSFVLSLSLPIFARRIALSAFGIGQNLSQRLDLSFLAGKMITEKFWLGEGLNTFIVNIPTFKGILSYSWLLQPVHNVPLLVFSETGIFGLIVLFVMFFKFLKTTLYSQASSLSIIILFVVLTWTMDHYWFSLQQNLLLVSILLGLSARIKEWKTG